MFRTFAGMATRTKAPPASRSRGTLRARGCLRTALRAGFLVAVGFAGAARLARTAGVAVLARGTFRTYFRTEARLGLAAGFTIEHAPGEPAKRPYEIAMKMWELGFYVRYGADTIQLAPPFISERAEIDRLINALGDTIKSVA